MTELCNLILDELNSTQSGYLSGEEISQKLGISRTAVWKNINKLREYGYGIDSVTNRGYKLTTTPNILTPQTIGAYLTTANSNHLVCLDTVDSTNLHANRLVLDGAENGTVVISEHQSKGAGRLGRSFDSQHGKGIYMSMIIQPNCGVEQLSILTSCVGLAVCYVIEMLTDLNVSIKWPNDIIYGTKKLCGILTRLVTDAETGQVSHAIIGIGINVLQEAFPDDISDKAISLLMATDTQFLRAQICGELISQLNRIFIEENWLSHPPQNLLTELKAHSCTIGKEVEVISIKDGTKRGIATDISATGGLVVDFGHGCEEVISGEVSVRGILGYI